MQVTKVLESRLLAVVAGAAVVGILGAGAGWSAATITSANIANNTIKSRDVKDGTIRAKDLSPALIAGMRGPAGPQGAAGAAGAAGAPGAAGPAGGAGTYAGPHWSIIDRNVMKNGDSYLRSGPGTPPKGIGSLGIRTGDGADKAAFGNQVDFAGVALSSISTVKYSVYTTRENSDLSTANGPNVAVEIDPDGPAVTGGYSTLVYVPTALTANAWTDLDASTAKQWYLTRDATPATGCIQSSYCTLAQVKTSLPDATLYTVQLGKGRDFAFSGAVDALVINNDTYDFEPFGVTRTSN